MDERKRFFVDELKRHYEGVISGAHRAEVDAYEAADSIQQDARSREDSKSAVEQARMASGLKERRETARKELQTLIAFARRGLPGIKPDSPVSLGAMVDVSIEDEGESEERTLFVLPVGAGTRLEGPGGDGFISVVSPSSPVGRALQGTRVGDVVEVVVRGRDREWTVVDVC
jgi:transcription elongation GreA/GreB family factor